MTCGRFLAALGTAVLATATAPGAAAQEVGVGVAVSAARATDPGQRLTGVYVFTSVDAAAGPVRIWVSVPFATQRSTFDTFDPVTGAPVVEDDTARGVGDPLVRADVRVVDDASNGLQIAASASIKPALADADEGLGTGATDVAFGASVLKTVGRTSILADAQYWMYGDPDGLDLENTLSYSAGIARLLGSGRWSSMISVSGFSTGIDGGRGPVQLNLAALALAGRRQSVSVMVGVGLNSGADDLSFGVGWRVLLRQ